MSLPARLIVGLVLLLIGVALVAVGGLGARSRLPRNRYAGVRTAATLRSPQAFTLANRVAAAPIGAAGVVLLAASAVLLAGAPAAAAWVVSGIAVVGGFVLAGLGGLLGDRAATRLAAAPTSCAGTCPGCDPPAGCRDLATGRGAAGSHQPQEPGPPLTGPATSRVIQPP